MLESLQSSPKDSQATQESTPSSFTTFYEQYIAAVASQTRPVASIAEKTTLLAHLRARAPASSRHSIRNHPRTSMWRTKSSSNRSTERNWPNAAKVSLPFRAVSDELCLVHQSATEFLCQKLDNTLAHAYLAKVCLLTLAAMARREHSSETGGNDDGRAMSGEEGLFAYARRKYLVHGFQAFSLDQRIGPWIDADEVGVLGGGCVSN